MPKRGGLASILTGIALGAAALFLSKKENREKTKQVAKKIVSKAKKLEADYKKNPSKVTQQLKGKAKVIAKKTVAVAKKEVRKLVK
ncbi:hypothetical protein KA082_03470 [Candidatus Woesebacteria bacterium]|nr:hypothetical protein [Candidatus Woesebacteria bacterium]